MESKHVNMNHSTRNPASKTEMSSTVSLACAVEIAREISAAMESGKKFTTFLGYKRPDHYNWKAGVSLLQFSFILDQFIPRYLFQKSRRTVDEPIAKNFKQFVGSFPEGLSLSPYDIALEDIISKTQVLMSDVDQMIIVPDFAISHEPNALSHGVIETVDTHVGYVRIRMDNQVHIAGLVSMPANVDNYLSSTKMVQGMVITNNSKSGETTCIHGPAMQDTITIAKENFHVNRDSVFSMHCLDWPKEADRWTKRDRPSGWPGKELVQSIVADGCHVVPTSHPRSQNPDIEWRYSFSVAERTLARKLTDAQRQCYILLKTIVMHELSHFGILCSYHLKMLLFWHCEKIPDNEWSSDAGLATMFLCLLDELVYCVATHCLPHYFIPENNLFEHVHSDFLADIAHTVSCIRRNPLQYVLTFNKRFRFKSLTLQQRTFNLTDHFSDIIADVRVCQYDLRKCYKKQQQALWRLGQLCLREQMFTDAHSTFLYLENVTEFLTGCTFPTGHVLYSCASVELDLSEARDILGNVDRTDVYRNTHTAYFFSKLARSYKAGTVGKTLQVLNKTAGVEEHFYADMLASAANTAAVKMDFCMFLVQLLRYDEAIPLLKEIMATECKHPLGHNTYSNNMTIISDDKNLHKETCRHTMIRTMSVAFAYYVFAKICCDENQETKAMALLPDFQRLCSETLMEGTVDNTMHAQAFSLLGYTYLAVQDYAKAGQAFRTAAQLVDGYTLAQENYANCEAIRHSAPDVHICFYKRVLGGTLRPSVSVQEQTPTNNMCRKAALNTEVAATENKESMCPEAMGSHSTMEISMERQNKTTDVTVTGTSKEPETSTKSQEIANSHRVFTDTHDWTAGVSLHQLSFILDQFLPQRHVCHPQMDVTSNATLSHHRSNLLEITLEPSGSFYDGFHLPVFQKPTWTGKGHDNRALDSHLSVMFVHMNQTIVTEGHKTPDSFGVIEDEDTYPGHIRIRLLNPCMSSCKVPKADTGNFYLSNRMVQEREFVKLTEDVAHALYRGPAATVNEQNTVNCDSVLALPCPQWPKSADYWTTRDRPSGWPDKELIQSIVAVGCHVVPTSHPRSQNPDIEWRYSFSVAERTLARKLTDAQRQCYILLKTIVMRELNHCSVLSSYHLKTVFLWQCEKIPATEWSTETGLATNFLWLLDELVYCVASHHLPHYFIPEVNLFEHNHLDFLEVVADTLAFIRREPISRVLAFDKQFCFKFSVASCDLVDILNDVIDDAVQSHDTPQLRFKSQSDALQKTAKQLMTERRSDEALCVFTQEIQLYERICRFDGSEPSDDYTICSLMSHACLELPKSQRVYGLEYVKETFPDNPDRDRLLLSLAMFCHEEAFTAGSEHNRQEMLQKADVNFVEAITYCGVDSIAVKMNYITFLVHLHCYDKAVPLLKEFIAMEANHPTGINGYGLDTRNSVVDENLLKEINRHGNIETASVAFAYYVLAKIYCETNHEAEAMALLPDFQQLCSDTLGKIGLQPTMHCRAYSLLGYTYLAVQDYTQAGQAFRTAAQLEDDYTLAEENYAKCDILHLCELFRLSQLLSI